MAATKERFAVYAGASAAAQMRKRVLRRRNTVRQAPSITLRQAAARLRAPRPARRSATHRQSETSGPRSLSTTPSPPPQGSSLGSIPRHAPNFIASGSCISRATGTMTASMSSVADGHPASFGASPSPYLPACPRSHSSASNPHPASVCPLLRACVLQPRLTSRCARSEGGHCCPVSFVPARTSLSRQASPRNKPT